MKPNDYFLGTKIKPLPIDLPATTERRNIHIEELYNETDRKPDHLKLKENNNEITENEIVHNTNKTNNNEIIITTHNSITTHNNITTQVNEFKTLPDYEQLTPTELHIYDKRPIMTYLKDMLILDHPFLSLLFKRSLKDPSFIRMLRLVFSLSMQFAVSAMLYTDNLIDQSHSIDNVSVIII
jgi:hypothetical protein